MTMAMGHLYSSGHKIVYVIMPLPLHGLTVTVHGHAVIVAIKITYITLSDNEHCAF